MSGSLAKGMNGAIEPVQCTEGHRIICGNVAEIHRADPQECYVNKRRLMLPPHSILLTTAAQSQHERFPVREPRVPGSHRTAGNPSYAAATAGKSGTYRIKSPAAWPVQ
ncbi:hypothetical protein D3C80_1879720 [compost metagenome]